ncbi:MAG TPA: four helix bundle protein [Proteobacteria bacterium]|nr:four helix bundle protein [Pseudomonadota bacterium]
MNGPIRTVNDLRVYQLSFKLAMEVFEMTKSFPPEEKYSLIDQIRRSSRSVPINIREGFAKRRYEKVLMRHANDSLGSSEETRGWLDFSLACRYINEIKHDRLDKQYDEVNAMLYKMMDTWRKF